MGEISAHLYKLSGRRFGLSGRSALWQVTCLSLGLGLPGGTAFGQSGTPANFGQKETVMPRGAFLRSPAKTVKVLNKELDDPVVMKRYAKLFNMPPALVRLALADLKLQPLTEDRNLEVWYVKPTPTGEVTGYRLRKVKKGTLVYALADGRPALIQVCGNPARIIAAPAGAKSDLADVPVYEPYSVVLGDVGTGVQSEVNVATRDAAPEDFNGGSTGSTAAQEIASDDFIEVSMPDVPPPISNEPPQLQASHAKRLLEEWLTPLLAALPTLAAFGGGGGGGGSSFLTLPISGSGIVTPPITTPPVPPTPPAQSAVPEPGGVGLLAGLVVSGAACWQGRRTRRCTK